MGEQITMWNSQSRVTKDGTRYTIDDLEGLINIIGVELDTGDEPLEEYPKDGLCEIHYSGYLSGITNGEYIYGVYEVLKDLLSDYPCSVAPLYKEAILLLIQSMARAVYRQDQRGNCRRIGHERGLASVRCS
jgi:hypothetical protein